jgi:hypothetical protein
MGYVASQPALDGVSAKASWHGQDVIARVLAISAGA